MLASWKLHPRSKWGPATTKKTKPVDKQSDNKGIKEAHRGANKERKHTKGQTSMLSCKRGCPEKTNVGLDLGSIVPLYLSIDDTRVTLKKVPKRDSRPRVKRRV